MSDQFSDPTNQSFSTRKFHRCVPTLWSYVSTAPRADIPSSIERTGLIPEPSWQRSRYAARSQEVIDRMDLGRRLRGLPIGAGSGDPDGEPSEAGSRATPRVSGGDIEENSILRGVVS